jgi:phosphate transport system permease protein
MNPIYSRRRRKDIVVRGLCIAATAFGVTWLALILITLLYNGVAGLNVQLFTENTPPPGSNEGGLLNAIVGSLIMTVIGVVLGLFTLVLMAFTWNVGAHPHAEPQATPEPVAAK